MPPRIGVLGGAFDPIHWGHLGAAIESAYQLGLDRVLLIPAGDPPHKKPHASALHRLEMVRRAAREHPSLVASDLETDHLGPHYTVGTLRRLRDLEPQSELYLLLGTDAAQTLPTWREPEALAQLAQIVVIERMGSARPGAGEAGLMFDEGSRVYTPSTDSAGAEPRLAKVQTRVQWPGVDVSSSEVRRRVGTGAPIIYLVPRSVADYLEQQRLYL